MIERLYVPTNSNGDLIYGHHNRPIIYLYQESFDVAKDKYPEGTYLTEFVRRGLKKSYHWEARK